MKQTNGGFGTLLVGSTVAVAMTVFPISVIFSSRRGGRILNVSGMTQEHCSMMNSTLVTATGRTKRCIFETQLIKST